MILLTVTEKREKIGCDGSGTTSMGIFFLGFFGLAVVENDLSTVASSGIPRRDFLAYPSKSIFFYIKKTSQSGMFSWF